MKITVLFFGPSFPAKRAEKIEKYTKFKKALKKSTFKLCCEAPKNKGFYPWLILAKYSQLTKDKNKENFCLQYCPEQKKFWAKPLPKKEVFSFSI